MNTLKTLRQELHMTQSDLANVLGVTPAAISRIESGVRALTDRMARQIAKEFAVNEEWLRAGTGDMFLSPGTEDEELIERLASLAAEDVPPERKRFISTFIRITSELDDAQLYALGDTFAQLAASLQRAGALDPQDNSTEKEP